MTDPADRRVVVIIPTRDRPAMLDEALASVLGQRGVDVEVVVVDDFSSVDLTETVTRLGDERVTFLRLGEHRERSAARNAGLDASTAPFVLFLDDDDLLAEDALRSLTHTAVATHAAVVGGQRVVFDENGPVRQQPVFSHRVRRLLVEAMWQNLDASDDLVVGRFLFRRHALEAVGGFEAGVTYSEDRHLLWLLARGNHTWAIIPEVVLLSRSHPGSAQYPTGDARARALQPIERARRAAVSHRAAERRLRGWDEVWRSRLLTQHGSDRAAAVAMLRGVWIDPTLVRSTFFRRELMRTTAKALVPRRLRPNLRSRDGNYRLPPWS